MREDCDDATGLALIRSQHACMNEAQLSGQGRTYKRSTYSLSDSAHSSTQTAARYNGRMFPSLRHRLLIFAAVALAAATWLLAWPCLLAADRSSGLTLLFSGSGMLMTLGLTLLVSLPVLAIATIVSAGGHPLSGVFVAGTSLLFITGAGGPIDGWLYNLHSPADYRLLSVEMILWQIGTMLLLLAIVRSRKPLQAAIPWLKAGQDDLHPSPDVVTMPTPASLGSGLVCAAVAAVVGMVLIRSSDAGQVIGSLIVAFAAGGAAGQLVFPAHRQSLSMLCAPALVAIVAYLYVSVNYSSQEELLRAWFNQTTPEAGLMNRLPGLALALPIYYTAAGLTGVTLGIGLGQSVIAAQKEITQPA